MAKGFSNKAVIYVRVSTSEQSLEGVSIEAQISKLTQYCETANLEVIEIVEDRAVSGGKHLAARPGGQRVLELIRTKAVTHVVGLKLDRLFRNAGDALSTIEQWDKSGVTTHLIDFMGGSSLDTRSAMGRMLLGVCATFAQFERDLCSQRTKDALQHKKKNLKTYCRGVFGFVQKGKDLVKDTAQQNAIAIIKSMREAGATLRAIASELTEKGIQTARGGKWYASTIKGILENDIHQTVGA